MNTLLKEKVSDTKTQIQKIENVIQSAKDRVDAQQKLIKTISEAKTEVIANLEHKIRANNTTVSETQESIASLIAEIQVLQAKVSHKDTLTENIDKAKQIRSKLNQKVETCEHNAEFFTENDVCPQCSQEISEDYKSKIIHDLHHTMQDNNQKISELETVLEQLQAQMTEINDTLLEITNKNIELSTKNSAVSLINKQIKDLEEEINTHKADTTNVDEEKRKLKELAQDAMEKIKNKTNLQEHRNLEEVANLLLKDTGIKTAIIREYLPIMNKLINKYLNAMDAYIHFELDESFNEIVKSRHRDEFTYASFSEGEKMRIDLAILFTWRQIAKMKNSVNTNLLILDESFDSSLDTAGTDYFLNLMNSFGDKTNIFVISHKGDQLFDKFRSVIKFEKRNDFSVIAKA